MSERKLRGEVEGCTSVGIDLWLWLSLGTGTWGWGAVGFGQVPFHSSALSSLSPWVSVTLQMLSLSAWTSLPLVLMHLLCYTTWVHRGQCFLFLGNLLCLFATKDSKELSVGLPLMKCTSTVFSTATVLSRSVYQSCLGICNQDLHFCKGKTFFSHHSHSSSISLSESSPWALDNAAFTPAFPFPFFPLLCFITN